MIKALDAFISSLLAMQKSVEEKISCILICLLGNMIY